MKTSNCEQHTLGMASQPAEPNSEVSYRCPWLCFTWSLLHPKTKVHTQQKSTGHLTALTHHCSAVKRNQSSPQKSSKACLPLLLVPECLDPGSGQVVCLCYAHLGWPANTKERGKGGERKRDELAQMSSSKLGTMVHTHNPSRRIPSLNELHSELKATLGDTVSKENERWFIPLIQHSKGGNLRIYLSLRPIWHT